MASSTSTYDRYSEFRNNGKISIVPFIKIPKMESDYTETYYRGRSRLDLISYDYYGNPNYGWLIMQANPEYGSLEFNIPDKTELRIPYPLETAIELYRTLVKQYYELN